MTREEKNAVKRAYQRGYQAALKHKWSDQLPPLPPVEVLQRLATASQTMRGKLDTFCAMLDPDDEWVRELDPLIQEWDDAIAAFREWMDREFKKPNGE